MIINIFSIKDKAVDAFLQPFFSQSLGSAVRSVRTVLSDPNHEFTKNVQDFSLYRLGEFDDSTGQLASCPEPEFVSTLASLLATTTPQ